MREEVLRYCKQPMCLLEMPRQIAHEDLGVAVELLKSLKKTNLRTVTTFGLQLLVNCWYSTCGYPYLFFDICTMLNVVCDVFWNIWIRNFHEPHEP